MPRTLLVSLLNLDVGLYGWTLAIEADLGRATTKPRARICRHRYTDAISCRANPVVCATKGTLTLDRKPTSSSYTRIRGRFSAVFPDGVAINGTFM